MSFHVNNLINQNFLGIQDAIRSNISTFESFVPQHWSTHSLWWKLLMRSWATSCIRQFIWNMLKGGENSSVAGRDCRWDARLAYNIRWQEFSQSASTNVDSARQKHRRHTRSKKHRFEFIKFNFISKRDRNIGLQCAAPKAIIKTCGSHTSNS